LQDSLVIGVDLGGTSVRAALVRADGSVLRRVERPTPVADEESVVAAINAVIDEVRSPGTVAIGVAVPSRIDRRRGRAVRSVNIPLDDVDLRDLLIRRHGLPAEIENDATAAAIGEWHHGAGRGVRHMVMVTLGTGVGGGLILDGRPYRGATGAAAEIGHLVVQLDGPPCQGSCTGRGHLEALASGTAATARARVLFGPGADARTLVAEAERGHVGAVAALAEMGAALGAGLASLVNVLEPELIVVGGGFAAAGELLLGPARAVLARDGLEPGRDTVRVVLAELGEDAGLVGAAEVGREALVAASAGH
jgi:glucokinase